jgi:hypothetical protein
MSAHPRDRYSSSRILTYSTCLAGALCRSIGAARAHEHDTQRIARFHDLIPIHSLHVSALDLDNWIGDHSRLTIALRENVRMAGRLTTRNFKNEVFQDQTTPHRVWDDPNRGASLTPPSLYGSQCFTLQEQGPCFLLGGRAAAISCHGLRYYRLGV